MTKSLTCQTFSYADYSTDYKKDREGGAQLCPLGALHVCEIGVVSLVWTMQEIMLNRNQVSGDILLLAALVKPV